MSVGQLHDLLVGFDAFLSTSDGLIPEVSLLTPMVYGLTPIRPCPIMHIT